MNAEQRVVLFLIDGMRPDGMMQADTPTLDSAANWAGRTR